MIRRTFLFLCVLGLLVSCINTPPAPVPVREVPPENVLFYTAFTENNLKFLSPVQRDVTEQTEFILGAPEELELSFTLKNINTGKNSSTIYYEKINGQWQIQIIFPQKGSYEVNILIKKGENFYHGAALISYNAQVAENSNLFVFQTDSKNQLVRILDAKEINETWRPGNLEFYWSSFTKYRTGLLEKDTLFTINKQTFSLPQGTEIRFNTGDAPSRSLAFNLPEDLELSAGENLIHYKQGTQFYVDSSYMVGISSQDSTLHFMGAALKSPAESAVAITSDRQLMGIQLSRNTDILIGEKKYSCADYVYISGVSNSFTINLAQNTPMTVGNTKLNCPAYSSITFMEGRISDISLSEDTTITVNGKKQEVGAFYMLLFDEEGNLKSVLDGK